MTLDDKLIIEQYLTTAQELPWKSKVRPFGATGIVYVNSFEVYEIL